MNRPRIITSCALAICAAGLLWLLWPQQREPRYEGNSLSEWLSLYRQPIGANTRIQSEEAADAVRHIGTNALPLLVTWVQEAQDLPPRRQRLFATVWGWSSGTPGRAVLLEFIGGRQLRAQRAFWAFEMLGETARGAVPDLARVAREAEGPTATSAVTALGYLGKDAVLPLLSLITNTARPLRIRHQALISLREMEYLGTNANSANLRRRGRAPGTEMTALLHLLSDPDASVRNGATNALRLTVPDALQQLSAP